MADLIFFGSDQYSRVALSSLIDSKIFGDISIVTDRPKPVKKGAPALPSEVEILAIKHKLKVSYYPTNNDELINFVDTLKNTFSSSSTVGLCASFDHLLPESIIDLFNTQLYNLHPSLLPQYRNVSPVQYAIALGDQETGITLFRITTGIDNGEIIAQAQEPILSEDTTSTLTPRLFKQGAQLFIDAVKTGFTPLSIPANPNHHQLIFTKRLTRDSGFIPWPVLKLLLVDEPVSSAEVVNHLLTLRLAHNPGDSRIILHDLIRALSPWPSVWSLVPTRKGELRVVVESSQPDLKLKIAGKPKSISYADFARYYL